MPPISIGNFILATNIGLTGALFSAGSEASVIMGINHTHWSINRFSVDGQSGLDIIGAYQGGGGGCCYFAPELWHEGMEIRVDWETGPSVLSDLANEFPGFADEAKYDQWLDKLKAQRRTHSKSVPLPDYTNQNVCGVTVHFLPCDEVVATTSCYSYSSPEYPIKLPLKLPEPKLCPN